MSERALGRAVRSLIEHELAQPDQLSCGAATLVMARALMDEEYAWRLASSCPSLADAPTKTSSAADKKARRAGCQVASVFEREVALVHRTTTSLSGLPGERASHRLPAQLPWPRRLGTPPWALARALSGLGTRYRVTWARGSRGFIRALAALRSGRPVPLYVGARGVPRHVTLLIGHTGADAALIVYDPARGKLRHLTRAEFESGDLKAATGWPQAWWLLLPRD